MPEHSHFSLRPTVITANWKMYKTIDEATQFITELMPLIKDSSAKIYIAVPFTAILPASQLAKGSPIVVGAQNMNEAEEGAFTGEIAGRMLKNAGAQFVILGHSERRKYFNESNEKIRCKILRALKDGLQPTLCVGENLEERQSGIAEKIVRDQLLSSLEGVSPQDLTGIILAYEPIWAIGTGMVASAEDAQGMHHFCRELIAEKWGKEVAGQMILQYGGSVRPENASLILKQEDIDGLLIGGASLSVKSFIEIIDSVGSS